MRTVPVKADTLADLKDQEGQGLTEYLILVVLISLFCIAAAEHLGKNINTRINKAAEKIAEEINVK
jgi:Flp pilus assembly pilin Flp